LAKKLNAGKLWNSWLSVGALKPVPTLPLIRVSVNGRM
jgi:hypothetical protein